MLNKIRSYESIKKVLNHAAALALVFGVFAVIATAQTTGENMSPKVTEMKPMPALTDYKEIKIGMTADEVRDKLGKAKIDDKDGFYYQISDEEFAQIRIDKAKNVRLLSITYTDKNKNTPKYTDVFGTEAVEAAKPDGSVYKMIRYPHAGYWVAYSRTAGDKPTVTVTMQKIKMVKVK